MCLYVCRFAQLRSIRASFSAHSSVLDRKSNADPHRYNFSNDSVCGTNRAHHSIGSSIEQQKYNRQKHNEFILSLTSNNEQKKNSICFSLKAEYLIAHESE